VDIVTAWLSWTTRGSQTEALSPQLTFKPELKQASDAWTSGLTKMRPSAENLRHWSDPEFSMSLLRRDRHLEQPYRTEFANGLKVEESADRQRAKSTIIRL
jgi:hypothetical protein